MLWTYASAVTHRTISLSLMTSSTLSDTTKVVPVQLAAHKASGTRAPCEPALQQHELSDLSLMRAHVRRG